MDRNRRVHQRHEIVLPVVLVVDDREIEASTVNLSLGGMYIATAQQVPYGTRLKVRVRLPALKEESSIEATCRWTHTDGIGVQFGSLRAAEVWALNQIFTKKKA